MGGFGLGVARWLIDCGAKHIVLLGRSGDSKPEARKAVQELRDKGAEILVARVDVSKEDELNKLLTSIEKSMPPLRGVIHAAMVLEDVFLEMMTSAQLKKVMDPKMLGAWNLHTQTLKHDLDFFIMFSSFTSLVGNSGQANYSAGNSFLDMLSSYRKAKGLPSISIGWGSIGNVGYVAEHEEIKNLFRKQGVFDLSLEQAWRVIAYGLKKELEYIGAMPIDWKKFSKYSSGLLKLPRFSKLMGLDKNLNQDAEKDEHSEFILPDSPEELKEYLLNSITKTVAGVLGIAPAKLNREQALEKYGLDSLMAVELNVQLKELTNIDFPKMTLLQKGLNIIELVEMIEKKILEGRTE
jgi:acyl carrier protein